MRPYGALQECQLQDRKRRYLNGRMSHADRRKERRDKRAARAAGKREAAAQMAEHGGTS